MSMAKISGHKSNSLVAPFIVPLLHINYIYEQAAEASSE